MVSSDACYDAMMLMWVPKEISDSNGSIFNGSFVFNGSIIHLDAFGTSRIWMDLGKSAFGCIWKNQMHPKWLSWVHLEPYRTSPALAGPFPILTWLFQMDPNTNPNRPKRNSIWFFSHPCVLLVVYMYVHVRICKPRDV